MGSWGVGTFENDDALDFIGRLGPMPTKDDVLRALEPVGSAEKATIALAAACGKALCAVEILVASVGKPAATPDELRGLALAWTANGADIEAAAKAIENVALHSELASLREGEGSYATWIESLNDLRARLGVDPLPRLRHSANPGARSDARTTSASMADGFADHVTFAIGEVWSDDLPRAMLDVWWARDAARAYALLERFGYERSATLFATYAAVDRAPPRSRHASLTALHRAAAICAGTCEPGDLLERVASILPRTDPEVVQAIVSAGRGEAAGPEGDTPGSDGLEATLSAARQAALAGDSAALSKLLAEADSEYAQRNLMVIGALGLTTVPPEWIGPIGAHNDDASAHWEDGIIAFEEVLDRKWAVARCAGQPAIDALTVEALVEAHVRARNFVGQLGAPVQDAPSNRDRVLESVMRHCETRRPSRTRVLADVLRHARAGDIAIVREAVDRLENAFGPLLASDDQENVVEVLSFYAGRSRDLADGLEHDARAGLRLRRALVVAGLQRDDELALAAHHAQRVLADPRGSVGRELVELIAPTVLTIAADARPTIVASAEAALRSLPGRSRDDVLGWLAAPRRVRE